MTSAPDQIPHPRRLLILTPTTHSPSLIPPFLHSLTGTPVSAASPNDPGDSPAESADGNAKGGRGGGFAGYTTHPPLALKNRYYSAEVPVWVDEIPIPVHPGNAQQRGTESAGVNHPDSKNTHTHTDTEKNEGKVAAAAEWKTEFSSPEARVVRDALGAVVICLPNPSPSSSGTAGLEQEGYDYADRDDVRVLTDFVRNVAAVIRLIEEEREDDSGGGGGDVLGLVVLVGSSPTPAPTAPSMSAAEDLNISEADAEAEEEPFSPAWWEDRFFDLGITGLEVVSWDPKRHDSAEKNKFGGMSLFYIQTERLTGLQNYKVCVALKRFLRRMIGPGLVRMEMRSWKKSFSRWILKMGLISRSTSWSARWWD